MFVFRSCRAVLFASIAFLWASGVAHAAGGGSFGALPPRPPTTEVPEPPSSFEALRKPPIPVSFLTHDGGWIQFWYPPSARDRTAPLIAQADDLRAELAEHLGRTPLDGVEIRIARGPEEMATLAPALAPTLPPEGSPPSPPQVPGIAYPKLRLIVLSLGPVGSTDSGEMQGVFRRELARLALAEAVSGRSIPAWFADGFVHQFSRDGEWEREWILYGASIRHRTRPTSELDAMLYGGGTEAALASAEAAGLVEFLLKPQKSGEFSATVERLRQGDGIESALVSGYGSSLPVIERRWRTELSRRSTLATILSSMAVPAILFVVWGALRLIRRHRSRLAAAKLDKKTPGTGTASEPQRVHIVLGRRDDRLEPPLITEAEIPKVEHEGEWHTLH